MACPRNDRSDPEREEPSFVSRGGLKLAAALDAWAIDPTGWVCADLGSNVGGFVHCLILRGARRVYAIDTGYGTLAYSLRNDPRIKVMERTNAMHVTLPEPVDLVTIDVGWTRQQHILPNAVRLLKPDGRIITLIKPHYEADRHQLRKGILPSEVHEEVLAQTRNHIRELGLRIAMFIPSPIAGHQGNQEYLALLSLPQSSGTNGY